ncbi:phage major capsid protein [Mycolicibacterium mageritense]|uniref:phage major capsid protein n=1 Tax=Mycolicibacterium mageritense TaxID=53462 RepID=UPI0011D35FAB|nr:phage major capsid protein [Mycolicibacterium mageritense]TXI63085.1 MAG: phage major capsid protein [Mycolicibacterium mageritense]
MAVGTTTATELTQEQVAKILVKPLEEAAKFLAAGPRIFDTNSELRIPKLGAPTTVTWVGENEQIPEANPDFDEVVLLPSTMKSLKTLTRYSNELARQSVVALDQALKDRLVTDVAAKLDSQLFGASGDGTTTPQGLFAWAGTQTLAVNAALELDDLHDAEALALGENVDPAQLRWVMTSRELIDLRKIKATDGNYIVQPDVTAAGGYTLLGHPVIVTNRVPDLVGTPNTGRAALVDFSQVAVARDMAPTVKILDQTFGDYDQMAIRVVCRYDAKPLNPEAVIKLTGITI